MMSTDKNQQKIVWFKNTISQTDSPSSRVKYAPTDYTSHLKKSSFVDFFISGLIRNNRSPSISYGDEKNSSLLWRPTSDFETKSFRRPFLTALLYFNVLPNLIKMLSLDPDLPPV